MKDFTCRRWSILSALLAMFVVAGSMITLGGCNTTAGLGQDVSATGKAVTNSADKVKQGL
ncbi:MAG TPA: entericidin A/B family lipoprotein [Acetobacteraceae bacterium]|jgi:predicted small secreted protein|nr:entericidin A/B family lipoprotein [Acetobacteraceae bacterium]